MKERLERLKTGLSLEWGELAELLDVSRSMLDHVRNGIRSFGPKAIRRLEQAEREAGILPDDGVRFAARAVVEDRGEYVTKNQVDELRKDLAGLKADAESIIRRADEMLRKMK